MPPTVRNLADPNLSLPDYLIIDASVLLSKEKPIGEFLRRIGAAYYTGQTIPLVDILTLEECYFKIISGKYKTDSALNQDRRALAQLKHISASQVPWHDLYKSAPGHIQRWQPDLLSFFQVVQAIPLEIIRPDDLVTSVAQTPSLESRMRHYTHSCCILPKDAYLVAIAERLGVWHIATLDHDFERLTPEFTIYICP
jgi:hypothetical protein